MSQPGNRVRGVEDGARLRRVGDVLGRLEAYYDTVPRAGAEVHEVGPFTLFVRSDPQGWPFYARPRRGADQPVSPEQVEAVRARQRELGAPESLEWVHETTPGLLPAALAGGLAVAQCPLLALSAPLPLPGVDGVSVRLLGPDDVAPVADAIGAGFAGTDEVAAGPHDHRASLVASGLLAMAGAYDDHGAAVGGGSHAPRGDTTELTGIAVLPRARRRGVGAAGLDVRVLSGDDWAAWRDIRLRALRDSPEAFGSTYAREVAYSEQQWREHLEDPDEVALLVEQGGRVVAMGGGYPDLPGMLHVAAMWVDPSARGKGVGHVVLDGLRRWADQRSLRLHLDVARGNAAARRSYERYGFVGTGENRPLRPGSAETVERMVLPGAAGASTHREAPVT